MPLNAPVNTVSIYVCSPCTGPHLYLLLKSAAMVISISVILKGIRFVPVKNIITTEIFIFLTGGNSFSATTLFAQELKGQPNVKIVGEETGGGAYGNNAWIIPELVLPNTRLNVSIPEVPFRNEKELVKEGRGVAPRHIHSPNRRRHP